MRGACALRESERRSLRLIAILFDEGNQSLMRQRIKVSRRQILHSKPPSLAHLMNIARSIGWEVYPERHVRLTSCSAFRRVGSGPLTRLST